MSLSGSDIALIVIGCLSFPAWGVILYSFSKETKENVRFIRAGTGKVNHFLIDNEKLRDEINSLNHQLEKLKGD